MPAKKKSVRRTIKRSAPRKSLSHKISSWVSRNVLLATIALLAAVSMGVLVFGRPTPTQVMLEVAGTFEDYITPESVVINAVYNNLEPEEAGFIAKSLAKQAGKSEAEQEKAAQKAKDSVADYQSSNTPPPSNKSKSQNDDDDSPFPVVVTPAVPAAAPVTPVAPPIVVDTTKKGCVTSAGTTVGTGETMIGLVKDGKNEVRVCNDGKWDFAGLQGEPQTPAVSVKPIYAGGKNCYNGNFVVGDGSVYNSSSGDFSRCDEGVVEKVTKHTDNNFYNDEELKAKKAQEAKDKAAKEARERMEADKRAQAEENRLLALKKAKDACLKNSAKQWLNDQCIDKPGTPAQPASAVTQGQWSSKSECESGLDTTKYSCNFVSGANKYVRIAKQAEVYKDPVNKNNAEAFAKKQAECRAKTSVSGQIKTTYKWDGANCVVDTVVDLATGKAVGGSSSASQPDNKNLPKELKSTGACDKLNCGFLEEKRVVGDSCGCFANSYKPSGNDYPIYTSSSQTPKPVVDSNGLTPANPSGKYKNAQINPEKSTDCYWGYNAAASSCNSEEDAKEYGSQALKPKQDTKTETKPVDAPYVAVKDFEVQVGAVKANPGTMTGTAAGLGAGTAFGTVACMPTIVLPLAYIPCRVVTSVGGAVAGYLGGDVAYTSAANYFSGSEAKTSDGKIKSGYNCKPGEDSTCETGYCGEYFFGAIGKCMEPPIDSEKESALNEAAVPLVDSENPKESQQKSKGEGCGGGILGLSEQKSACADGLVCDYDFPLGWYCKKISQDWTPTKSNAESMPVDAGSLNNKYYCVGNDAWTQKSDQSTQIRENCSENLGCNPSTGRCYTESEKFEK